MQYLHLVSTDKFIEPFVKFINFNFKSSNHYFIAFTTSAPNHISRNYDNVTFQEKILTNITFWGNAYKTDHIFLHSLFSMKILIFFFLQPWLLKKCYWVVWGADLYMYKNRNNSLKNKFREFFRRFVIKRFGHIVTLVKGDYKLAEKWYSVKGEYHHGAYVNPISKKYLDSLPIIKKDKNEPVVIQIGNSADSTNNHIDALNSLVKFKEENIKIFAPLSYGNKEYARQVIEEGNKLFGDKFIPLTEFLTPDKYSLYLNNIDISIFNNDRQQGLFNISALAYLKKKIYLRNNITSYDHLLNEGLQLYNRADLDGISFEEFVRNEKNTDKEKIGKLFDEEHLKGIWEAVFKDAKK